MLPAMRASKKVNGRRSHSSCPSQTPAGWLGEGRFGRGGRAARANRPSITVRTVNPRRGTSWRAADRLHFLEKAVRTIPSDSVTVYLTSAGFFGARAKDGRHAGDGGDWELLSASDLSTIDQGVGSLAATMPTDSFLVVGVDRDRGGTQELWFYRGGTQVRFHCVARGDAPTRIDFAGFKALAFICGAIYDSSDGNPLDPARHLQDVDVVLDAGHLSLNRVWTPVVSLGRKRWAFQRKLQEISPYCGAIFSQSHGNRYGTRVRDCDNWIVYRGDDPFPGKRRGYEIAV